MRQGRDAVSGERKSVMQTLFESRENSGYGGGPSLKSNRELVRKLDEIAHGKGRACGPFRVQWSVFLYLPLLRWGGKFCFGWRDDALIADCKLDVVDSTIFHFQYRHI